MLLAAAAFLHITLLSFFIDFSIGKLDPTTGRQFAIFAIWQGRALVLPLSSEAEPSAAYHLFAARHSRDPADSWMAGYWIGGSSLNYEIDAQDTAWILLNTTGYPSQAIAGIPVLLPAGICVIAWLSLSRPKQTLASAIRRTLFFLSALLACAMLTIQVLAPTRWLSLSFLIFPLDFSGEGGHLIIKHGWPHYADESGRQLAPFRYMRFPDRWNNALFGGPLYTNNWSLKIAPWAIALPSAAIAFCLRQKQRRLPHLCPTCGYDLRATPTRCPECGHFPSIGT